MVNRDVNYDELPHAQINLKYNNQGIDHNGSIRGKYGYQIHPKANIAHSVEMLPQIKYKNNRSFLTGGDGGLIPNEDSHWDTSNQYTNASKEYMKIKMERERQGQLLYEQSRPKFIRDAMKNDDIMYGENMGEWKE